MVPDGFKRVSERNRCPICGKPDWCLVSSWAALCPREPNGTGEVWGDCGFLHVIGERPSRTAFTYRPPPPLEPDFDAEKLAEVCRVQMPAGFADESAAKLGVSAASLVALGMGYSIRHGAATFPMRDATDRVIGIRLRRLSDGEKWAVTGSRAGLMYATRAERSGPLMLCEGPTDAAALMDMGFWTVARPSCSGGARLVSQYVATHKPQSAVIVSDTDRPGMEGATRLADELWSLTQVKVIVPTRGKDARAWRSHGATRREAEQVIRGTRQWSRRASR